MNLAGVTIAIVGGDRREQEIARCAAAEGATVRSFGFPWPTSGIEGVLQAKSAREALKDAHIALFPIPGIAADGALFAPSCPDRIVPDREMMASMRRPAHVILGWADANLKGHCEALDISIHEYEWDQDLMLLRGPAIVEGMLRVIIENTDITIHRAQVCMVGQGTIGTLATRALVGLGARVHVAARNRIQRAAAYAAGAEPHELTELVTVLPTSDILISSVPAQVVDRRLLETMNSRSLLIDLAAPPGGIDRAAAQELGLKFIWARGLGSRAPITVGRSQWSGIRRRVVDIVGAHHGASALT
jgi:dipicolinate synthase subunit A